MSSRTKPEPFIFAGLDKNGDPIITDLNGKPYRYEEEYATTIAEQYKGYEDKKKYTESIIVEWTNPTWIYIRGKKIRIG